MPRDGGDGSKERRRPASATVGASGMVVLSCADTRLLLCSLVVLFFLFAFSPLLPFLAGFPPASDLRACLSGLSSPGILDAAGAASNASSPLGSSLPPPPPLARPPPPLPENYHPVRRDVVKGLGAGPNGTSASVVNRAFNPVGTAAYLFIQMGAYRGGPNTFAVVGLASKPLHVFARPTFQCGWFPHGNRSAANSNASATVPGRQIHPDWGYGRVYTVVVVNCTFPGDVGADGSGGRLVLSASAAGGGDLASDVTERIEALVEAPGSVNASSPPWSAPPRYEYLYCGSPLYGNLSPQRVREWVAYHAKLFDGPGKSHFVFYDAGGVHPGVMEVLRPWMEMGLVTLHDVREQERFDGYYHNQFLVVNDCLHRHRFAARWVFFFDVDEFLYVAPKSTLDSLLAELAGFTQFTFQQMPMSSKLCRSSDAGKTQRMWGMEKLVYRDVKRGVRRDRKYAIQPRGALAVGVHMSQHLVGPTLHRTERRISYFHYHGTVADRRDPCRDFSNATKLTLDDGTPFVLDTTLRALAPSLKLFELQTIGPRLRRTSQ